MICNPPEAPWASIIPFYNIVVLVMVNLDLAYSFGKSVVSGATPQV